MFLLLGGRVTFGIGWGFIDGRKKRDIFGKMMALLFIVIDVMVARWKTILLVYLLLLLYFVVFVIVRKG